MPRALHPWLVHFPLALFGMSFVFDVLSLRLGRFGAAMVEAALFNVLGGLVAALPTAAAGVRDFVRVLPHRPPVRRIARWHAALNLLAIALFASGLPQRWQARGAQVTPVWPLVLSALGVVLLGVAGYLGGVLVHNAGEPDEPDRSVTR